MRQSTAVAAGFILLNSDRRAGGLSGERSAWPTGTGWFARCVLWLPAGRGAGIPSRSSLTLAKAAGAGAALLPLLKMVYTALSVPLIKAILGPF